MSGAKTLRWDRLEELMKEAAYTDDYDVTMVAEQMIEYLSTERSAPIRALLVPQVRGGGDDGHGVQ